MIGAVERRLDSWKWFSYLKLGLLRLNQWSLTQVYYYSVRTVSVGVAKRMDKMKRYFLWKGGKAMMKEINSMEPGRTLFIFQKEDKTWSEDE